MTFGRSIRLLALLAMAMFATACATIPPNAGSNPADPWERYNRHMSEFNDRVDRAVLKPVATAYADYVPEGARRCVTNVFNNLWDVPSALNNLLQGKPAEAASDLCRVVINSTVGLLGCFDVAQKMGLQRTDEDFGQTLGVWGSGPGPYFVWPFLGPSSVRDSVGRVVGFYTDPLDYVEPIRLRNSLWGTRLVDTRAQLLPAEKIVDGAALDKYQFIRDAYLQRRQNQVYDGNPPRPKDDEEELDPPPAAPASSAAPNAADPKVERMDAPKVEPKPATPPAAPRSAAPGAAVASADTSAHSPAAFSRAAARSADQPTGDRSR